MQCVACFFKKKISKKINKKRMNTPKYTYIRCKFRRGTPGTRLPKTQGIGCRLIR